MARRARTTSNIDALPSVKLFVASTGWPYKPTWGPVSPTVILTGGAERSPPYVSQKGGHVCALHLQMFRALLRQAEAHDNVFLVDLSLVASHSEWREEVDRPARATRMLAKWWVKFNSRNATVVAHGDDAALLCAALRLLAEGEVQSAVHRLILVGEGPVVKGRAQELGKMFHVDLVRPALKAVQAAVSRGKAESMIDVSDLFVVAVDFTIDPFLKQLKQTTHDVTSAAVGTEQPIVVNAENLGACGGRIPGLTIDRLEFGMIVEDLNVQVLSYGTAGDVFQATLADPLACVEALLPSSLETSVKHGAILRITGRVVAVAGRLLLLVDSAKPSAGFRSGYTAVRAGVRNMSQRDHRFGCVIIRGSKCALVRKANNKLEIPSSPPRGFESAAGTAVRATMEACKINQEEFALVHDVPPVVAYEAAAASTAKVTAKTNAQSLSTAAAKMAVYMAVATSPEEKMDGCCDIAMLENTDPYEWCSCEEALLRLETDTGRSCLLKLVQAVAEAAHAGFLDNDVKKSELFRPALPAAMNDLGLNQSLALMAVEVQAIADSGGHSDHSDLGGHGGHGNHGSHGHGHDCDGGCGDHAGHGDHGHGDHGHGEHGHGDHIGDGGHLQSSAVQCPPAAKQKLDKTLQFFTEGWSKPSKCCPGNKSCKKGCCRPKPSKCCPGGKSGKKGCC